jgi:peroxiredoxin
VLAEVGMSTPRSAITLGMIAPDFTLPTVDGRMISLSSYRGTAHVILAFLRGAR